MTPKQQYIEWQAFLDNIRKQTPAPKGESATQQIERKRKLEADPEKWFTYYFPNYCYAPPADFHKESTNRILTHDEYCEVRNWSRELAKDTRTMMEVLYLMLTRRKKYCLMSSNSFDNSVRFLAPYKANLEANERIIHDYGIHEFSGQWEAGEFKSKMGFAFRAIGAGQSPRGTKIDETRPDIIIINDIDTDEDCRNQEIISKRWAWIEDALLATRSISKSTLILFLGNIIAQDCCVVRAHEIADHVSVVNIKNDKGESTWPEKNSLAHIERVLSQKSYASQQKEYFNNPIEEGQVFKDLKFGKCPDLKKLPFALIYADPATSNNDKPGVRTSGNNSTKAVVLMGCLNNTYYVYKAFVDTVTNATFVDWLYAAMSEALGKTLLYCYIENNSLQNPFYQQILLPLINKKGKQTGISVPVLPDERKKPDKFFRIEATLDPINRTGRLIFNENEKLDPGMKRLMTQFKGVSPKSKMMDGPDAVEGGVYIINAKYAMTGLSLIKGSKTVINQKRY